MFAVFTRFFLDRLRSLIAYCMAGAIFLLMFIGFYPSILEQSEEFTELFEQYPEGMLKILDVGEINFNTLERFLEVEQYSITWPILAIIFCIGMASAALAGSIDRGSIELVLSRAVSRTQLYIARYLTGVVSIVLFAVVSILSVFPMAAIAGIEYDASKHFAVFGAALLFMLAVFSMAYAISAMTSEKGKATMLAAAVIFVMYVFNIAAGFIDALDWLQYLSFFHYFDYHAALVDGQIPLLSVVVLGGSSVVTALLGEIGFSKRDISL